ncbi:uncharacterized protein LOC62_07G009820 [Vanrija pseudolonga]|uniref:Uncharacterized protein n=1 Tax=Vanrija pseudolonga TaxID=143232 RepID=A0AAF1BRW7_9TREE|nr:hypothetical protein LOC62_07G009820 [Vanrija pseudolonga]
MSSNARQTDVDGGVRRAALFAAYENRQRVEPAPVKPVAVSTISTSTGPQASTTQAPAAPRPVAALPTRSAPPVPAFVPPAAAPTLAATTPAAPMPAAPIQAGPSLVLNIGGPGGAEAAGTALAAHILRSIGADFAIPGLLAGVSAASVEANAGSETKARPGSMPADGPPPAVSPPPAAATRATGAAAGIGTAPSVAPPTPVPAPVPAPAPLVPARPTSMAQATPVPVPQGVPPVAATTSASTPFSSAPARPASQATVSQAAPPSKPSAAPVVPARPRSIAAEPPAAMVSRAPLPGLPTSASTPTTSPDTPTSSSTTTASRAHSSAPVRKPLPTVPQATPSRPLSVAGSGAASSSSPAVRPLPTPPGASPTSHGPQPTGKGPSPTSRKLPEPPVTRASAENTMSPAPSAQATSPPTTTTTIPTGDLSFSLGTASPATSPPKPASRSPKPPQGSSIPPVTYDDVVELAGGAPVHTVTTESGKPMFFFSALEAFNMPPLDNPPQASSSAAGTAKPRAPSSDFTFNFGTPSSPPRVPASVPSDGKAVLTAEVTQPTGNGVGASALSDTPGGGAAATNHTPVAVKQASGVPKTATAVGTAIAATAIATSAIATTSSASSGSREPAAGVPPPTSSPTASAAAPVVAGTATASPSNASAATTATATAPTATSLPPAPVAPALEAKTAPTASAAAPTPGPPIDRWKDDDARIHARFHPPMRLLPRGDCSRSQNPEDYHEEWELEPHPEYGYPPPPCTLLKKNRYFPHSSYSFTRNPRRTGLYGLSRDRALDPKARTRPPMRLLPSAWSNMYNSYVEDYKDEWEVPVPEGWGSRPMPPTVYLKDRPYWPMDWQGAPAPAEWEHTVPKPGPKPSRPPRFRYPPPVVFARTKQKEPERAPEPSTLSQLRARSN